MSSEAAENEPSMEEILASIRRIIDEDEDGGENAEAADEVEAVDEPVAEAAPEPAPEPEPEPAPEPEVTAEDEVLELTDKVEEPGAGTDPLALDDDLMIVDREEEEVAPVPEPEPEPEPVAEVAPEPEPEPEPVVDEDALVSAPAATAASGAFDALAHNLRVATDDGATLEGIVRELMRPMLKEWLDNNLPSIVEQKVEAEIERIARRR
ncbi:DUF2497 domain-containing protein [Hyphobacterium sp.]|uniref:DUF2497 domain-containing protein n=1 Tax=Hyphobacterium sp. TaxID=2004662 RepID=UPI003BAC4525